MRTAGSNFAARRQPHAQRDLPLREPGRHARPHDLHSAPTSTSATRSSRTWDARAWASSTAPSSPRRAMRRVGTNQIGRYSIHFHHAFGPKAAPANGYQFTLIGNAVDDASKWGITIHNSHYGLVHDNVVYNSRGAASWPRTAPRASTSSSTTSRCGPRAPASSRRAAATAAPQRSRRRRRRLLAARAEQHPAEQRRRQRRRIRLWHRRRHRSASSDIPKFKGADTTKAGEFVEIDTTDAPVLEFTGNEAYGAIQTGVAIGWNGTLTNSRCGTRRGTA